MTEKMDLDEAVQLVLDIFTITKEDITNSKGGDATDLAEKINFINNDLKVQLNNDFTGIIQEVTVQLIPIPKPKYPSLVEKKRMGGQTWFKDENDRTCWHYYFLKRRNMHD